MAPVFRSKPVSLCLFIGELNLLILRDNNDQSLISSCYFVVVTAADVGGRIVHEFS